MALPRVLFAMSPIGGGAEVFVEIAAGLRRRGWTADVLAPSTTRAFEADAGVRLRYFDIPPMESRAPELGSVAFHWNYGLGAHQALKGLELEYDLVMAHLPWGIAKVYAHERRRPLVGFCDCCWVDSFPVFRKEAPNLAPDWVSYALQCHLHEETMRACDRLLAPSRFFARHWGERAGGLAVDVIPHGRDPARYPHGADKAEAKRRAKMPVDRKMLLAVGYDFARKGHHHVAEVALRLDGASAYTVAAGPARDLFQSWFDRDGGLWNRFYVHPYAPHDAVQAYLQAADAFIFPSYMESFGLAPVEAMACGVPVVMHRSASLPELVDDGVEGFLCAEGDIDALTARVNDLLSDDDRRRAMGRAARARFERDFTLERTVAAYERYFLGVLEGRRAPALPAEGEGGAP